MIKKLEELKKSPCDDDVIKKHCRQYRSCVECVLDRVIKIVKGAENGNKTTNR